MKSTVKKYIPGSVKNAIKWLLHIQPKEDCAAVIQRLRDTLNWFGPELDSELGFFSYVEYHLPQFVTQAHYVQKDVLDLGCGVGGASAYFALKEAASVWGFDPSYLNDKVLSQVRQIPRCRFIPKALHKDLVGKQRFDLVYSRFVTEHIKDCGETFQMVFDLLRPGGRFLLTHNNYYGPLGGHDQAFIRHIPEDHRKVVSLAEPCWTKPEKCEASVQFRKECEGRHDWTVKEWHLTPEDCTQCLYYHRAQLWGHLLHQNTYSRDYPGEFYSTRCLNKITPFQLRQYLIEAGFRITACFANKCDNQPPKELLEKFSEDDLRSDSLLIAADKPG